MGAVADDGEDAADQFHLLTGNGLFDLSQRTPDYMTQMLRGQILPRNHKFVALHNRKRIIVDDERLIMYMRGGPTYVLVDETVFDTWAQGVKFDSEQTQKKFDVLWDTLKPATIVADVWNRVFGMGFVVLGFNDNRALSAPVEQGSATELVWAYGFSRTHIQEILYDENIGSNTFGKPVLYLVRSGRPGADGSGQPIYVHADRVWVHNESPHVHPLNGHSQLDRPWNDLEDSLSVGWASSEAYYGNASPKLLLKTQRPLVAKQEAAVDEQLAQTDSGVRRVIKMLSSMELVPLTGKGDIAKPLEHLIVAYSGLSNASGVPFSRFFRYHITSGDGLDWARREWYEFVSGRQHGYGKTALRGPEGLFVKLAHAGLFTKEERHAAFKWLPPRTPTREDIAKYVRNESIGFATAAKAGALHKDMEEHFEKLPDTYTPPAGEVTPGDETIQPEQKSAAPSAGRTT